ncbi:sulfotransferase ssu-1-like [Dermacentor variabilis]|uniref:sulfotransferase ssu-1-like n=1 Tax=Dermacentor variabilis TaxID=34621 RepID=UPI003F5BB188
MAVEVTPCPNGPLYVDFDGLRLNKRFSPTVVRDALRYKTTASDKFLLSYPKCGTHWAQQIAYLIDHRGVPPADTLQFHMYGPSLEKFGAETLAELPNRGLIRSHLPYDFVPKHPQARYVYVCRNPKDVCVSFFYHTKALPECNFVNGKFEDFFEIFLEGKTDFGDYFEHVLPWYERRGGENVLFLNYEDMKSDPRKHVLEMAAFMNGERYDELLQNESMLADVLKFSSSEYMKNPASPGLRLQSKTCSSKADVPQIMRQLFETPGSIRQVSGVVRSGRTGGWKEHFTPEMNERMERKIREKFSQTDLVSLWRHYGIL